MKKRLPLVNVKKVKLKKVIIDMTNKNETTGVKVVDINDIKLNPENPRVIKDAKFKRLVKSIKEFPQMLYLRPIVVSEDMTILGGNMRYKACVEAKFTEIPIMVASELTEEQQKEFIIKDNNEYGEWNWEELKLSWDMSKLQDWDIIELPNYEPNYNPFAGNHDVTDNDIQKAASIIEDTYSKDKAKNTQIDIICPNCGNQFHIAI